MILKIHKSAVFKAVLVLGTVLSLTACDIPEDGRPVYDSRVVEQKLDPCREAQQLVHLPITDFELGIASTWWLSGDGTGTITPMPGREPEATLMEEGRCGISKYALKITSTGTEIYGGGMGFNFQSPVDASEYDGIALWARRGENSKSGLFVGVSDPNTDEYNGARYSETGVPACLEEAEDDAQKCDRFGVGIGMETEWRFIKLPFTDFRQRGYGMEVQSLDITRLYGLNIGFETGDFEIWLDDISFYKEGG